MLAIHFRCSIIVSSFRVVTAARRRAETAAAASSVDNATPSPPAVVAEIVVVSDTTESIADKRKALEIQKEALAAQELELEKASKVQRLC